MGFLKYLLTFEGSKGDNILKEGSFVTFITGVVLWLAICVLFIAVLTITGPWLFLIPIGLLIYRSHKFYEENKKYD